VEELRLVGIEADGPAPGLELDVGAIATAPVRRAEFFGAGGTASRIVYVVDGSGSMDNALGTPGSPGAVRRELIRSISRLGPEQRFQLIFFTERPKAFPPGRLMVATDDAKQRAAAFMDTIRPDVGTDPIPALEAAFASLARTRAGDGDKVIYLLTDDFELDHRRLTDALARLNAKRTVRLHIVLCDELPAAARAGSWLRDLAARHGGQFRRLPAGD
ncbi:MAG: VWA domain-containing protein, partial [Planctomycetota bacterium]